MIPYTWIAVFVIFTATLSVNAYRCDTDPTDLIQRDHKLTGGKYLLKIDGNPAEYVPNERYQITIALDTFAFSNITNKFRKFIIALESLAKPDDEDVSYQTGRFELGEDMLSKFSETCKDTVTEVNLQPKRKVSLYWKAPPPKSGCVSIKATVIESRERWFAEDDSAADGFLTKTLCEDLSDNEDTFPEVLSFCSACDEAKYELAFQGNWIRNTHPKGFPGDTWATKFSDLIGASHKMDHQFWNDYQAPSDGLKELAITENTKKLELELMSNIENIRTIIKARGLEHPNMRGSTYAIFRVDNENHLVTVVSKMIPSPDWVVGVSNFELCQPDGTWKKSRTVNLYPRDVGTDEGVEYTEKKPSSDPEMVVNPISSSFPDDPRSPFYDESGEKMQPIAKLHFKLQKVFRKECDPERIQPEEATESKDVSNEHPLFYRPATSGTCQIVGWSNWSTCSATCGRGHMTRSIRFRNEPGPNDCPHIVKEETVECGSSCPNREDEPFCPNVIWGAWSPCSKSCGTGTKTRLRVPSQEEEDEDRSSNRPCPSKETVECNEGECKNEI
ncbi:spondin-1-like [Cylas formicarius]|uniref:spondin-1-like n=1 Tax=Cylas formicarius TaxID=197179 RepID=UPI002958434F|nr:spondin-1-like [Cylas formicarius]XP_060530887.1 spondin-1-like [Cylas formicarius]